jgi:hypothetical protein
MTIRRDFSKTAQRRPSPAGSLKPARDQQAAGPIIRRGPRTRKRKLPSKLAGMARFGRAFGPEIGAAANDGH